MVVGYCVICGNSTTEKSSQICKECDKDKIWEWYDKELSEYREFLNWYMANGKRSYWWKLKCRKYFRDWAKKKILEWE